MGVPIGPVCGAGVLAAGVCASPNHNPNPLTLALPLALTLACRCWRLGWTATTTGARCPPTRVRARAARARVARAAGRV